MRKKSKRYMKMYSLLLAAGLVLGLAGCGNATTSTTENATTAEDTANIDGDKDTSSDNSGTDDTTNSANDDSIIDIDDIQISETIEDSSDGGHAIEADGETAEYSNVSVKKTGEADGDEADFYGENAAIFATNGATLTLKNITVDTDGTHANGVFSYGEGTTVNISDSYIYTKSNCSGGLMTTGGGTMNATNLTIETDGNSSAAIRSDRGGGTVTVAKGSYTTNGTGSPAIYSTADITVNDAKLTSTASEGVVVEGKNSVTLNNVTLTADNNKRNSDKSDIYKAVMLYQSMSGDADEGTASFTMTEGSLINKNGDVFFVTNTVATINLENVDIANEDIDNVFLRAEAAGWGNEGSNGGNVTLNTKSQRINGEIIVNEVSTLNMYLTDGSVFEGAINSEGEAGEVYVELDEGSAWTLTGDSYITSLTCDKYSINLNGHKLYVDGEEYAEGTESTGTAVEANVSESGGPNDGDRPEGEPPAKPDGEESDGEPPAKPDGEKPEGEPPAKPDGE